MTVVIEVVDETVGIFVFWSLFDAGTGVEVVEVSTFGA